MGAALLSIRIAADPPPRLDKALARDVPEQASLSRTRLARLIAEGHVTLCGAVVLDPKAKVAEGDIIEIAVPEAVEGTVEPQDITLDVVYEDDALIVVNKPAGMVVHPAPGTPDGTLVNALLHHCGASLSGIGGEKRPGIVHRIDKDTSGLLVVANPWCAASDLAEQFEQHSVERKYTALVYGMPKAADPRLHGLRGVSFERGNILKVTTQLARHKTDRQKQAVLFHGGRHAVTRVRVVEGLGEPAQLAHVECWLETGRTHQIRVHMAHIGHGLVGDPVYGGRRKINEKAVSETAVQNLKSFSRQALHAAVLGFIHPISGEVHRFEAYLPPDMRQLLQSFTN
ncbi:MAG: RluA family pseudouridine synthase [Pseudomonadota bacterium]